ncbi:substrate-binding domain-containing protein [Alteribacillus sp. HJP-4]
MPIKLYSPNRIFVHFQSKRYQFYEEIVISFGTSCLYHTQANKLLQEAGIEGNRALEFPSIEMIKQSVKCGIGFALIPELAVKKELEEEQFKTLPLCPPIFSTHGLIVRKDRELNFPAKLFKSQVIDHFSSEMKGIASKT